MGSRAAVLAAAVTTVLAVAFLGGWATGKLPFSGAGDSQLAEPGVYLVAVGDMPQATLDAVALREQAALGVPVHVLPPQPLPAEAFDTTGARVVAEDALASMAEQLPEARDRERTVVIAITPVEMAIRGRPDWASALTFRADGPYALISTARLDPSLAGIPDLEWLSELRLRKLVARHVGSIYLGLEPSLDRRSVLYADVVGVDDVDAMNETFRPRPRTRTERAWARAVNAACRDSAGAIGAVLPTGGQSSPAQLLAASRVSIGVDGSLIRTIARLQPARKNREPARRLLSELAAARDDDRRAVEQLARRWDESVVSRWASERAASVVAIRALSLQLGVRRCAAYASG
jgi:hypothetical protein